MQSFKMMFWVFLWPPGVGVVGCFNFHMCIFHDVLTLQMSKNPIIDQMLPLQPNQLTAVLQNPGPYVCSLCSWPHLPECMSICCFRFWMRVNLTPQVGHWKGRSGPLVPGRADGLIYRWYGYWIPSSLKQTENTRNDHQQMDKHIILYQHC